MLYQLSYSRNVPVSSRRPQALSGAAFILVSSLPYGGGRIRTFEGVSRQIYSLLPLATWVPHPNPMISRLKPEQNAHPMTGRADGENRTRNLLITNQLLRQLSYVSKQRFYISLE